MASPALQLPPPPLEHRCRPMIPAHPSLLPHLPCQQVMSEAELAALVDEFAGGKRCGVTTRFLAVLRESAGGSIDAGGSGATAADTPGSASSGPSGSSGNSSRGLVPLYQQLYAVAVLQTLQSCLEAPEAAAAAQLAGLAPSAGGSSSFFGAEGNNALEAALAAASEQQSAADDRNELEHRLSLHVREGAGTERAEGCIVTVMLGNCIAATPQSCTSPTLPVVLARPPHSFRRMTTALRTSLWRLHQPRPKQSSSRRQRSQEATVQRQHCLHSWLSWRATSATIA